MRIATWNMGYWSHRGSNDSAWDYCLDRLCPDVLLFQEGKPAPKVMNRGNHLVYQEIGGTRKWGSGVYSRDHELEKVHIETAFGGCIVIASIPTAQGPVTLISLYGLIESTGPCAGYSITNLHRMLSDLTGILNGHVGGKRKIILAGDFNASVQFDQQQKNNSHRIFFRRLEDFGLVDCYKLTDQPYPTRTLRHNRSKVKWQNDYVFVSSGIAGSVVSCKVIEDESVRSFSDHNIVEVLFDRM